MTGWLLDLLAARLRRCPVPAVREAGDTCRWLAILTRVVP